MASRWKTDSQSEDMDIPAQHSEPEGYSGLPMESQDCHGGAVHHGSAVPCPTWGEGENEMAKCRRLYPKVRPYTVPAQQRVDNGWYQGET